MTLKTRGYRLGNLAHSQSQTGSKEGFPAAAYFIFGSVALLSAVGDIRMLLRGGVFGAHRIPRHLWRMCFALFIAAVSYRAVVDSPL